MKYTYDYVYVLSEDSVHTYLSSVPPLWLFGCDIQKQKVPAVHSQCRSFFSYVSPDTHQQADAQA